MKMKLLNSVVFGGALLALSGCFDSPDQGNQGPGELPPAPEIDIAAGDEAYKTCAPLGTRVLADTPLPSTISVDPALAEAAFNRASKWELVAGMPSQFHFNLDYPDAPPAPREMPWDSISLKDEPEAYMASVLDYCVADLEASDFNTRGTSWYHAPWLIREPMRGLTYEITAQPGTLHPDQTRPVETWAVGLYNEYGGYTFGQVWKDRHAPDTSNVTFPVGTVSCKLLFNQATPADAPYLKGSKTWDVMTREGALEELHLIQFDFAVRDTQADDTTGWVLGSFMHLSQLGDDEAAPPFSFGNLVPIGVMWGNDPNLGLEPGYDAPREGWMNPVVADHFASVRAGHHSQTLGRDGRVNGPVDNSRSSCMACHGRALAYDWTGPTRQEAMPWSAEWDATAAEVANYFRNLDPDEPFCEGADSLDYSLQLAFGIEHFNQWKIELDAEGRRAEAAPSSGSLVETAFASTVADDWISAVEGRTRDTRGED